MDMAMMFGLVDLGELNAAELWMVAAARSIIMTFILRIGQLQTAGSSSKILL